MISFQKNMIHYKYEAVLVLSAISLLTLIGCSGKSGEESGSKRFGEKAGEVLTDFANGVGKGLEQKLEVQPAISDSLKQHFDFSVSKIGHIGENKLQVYAICTKDFEGTWLSRALNEKNLEIGRSLQVVQMKVGEAKYITFEFSKETDFQLTKGFAIDLLQKP